MRLVQVSTKRRSAIELSRMICFSLWYKSVSASTTRAVFTTSTGYPACWVAYSAHLWLAWPQKPLTIIPFTKYVDIYRSPTFPSPWQKLIGRLFGSTRSTSPSTLPVFPPLCSSGNCYDRSIHLQRNKSHRTYLEKCVLNSGKIDNQSLGIPRSLKAEI